MNPSPEEIKRNKFIANWLVNDARGICGKKITAIKPIDMSLLCDWMLNGRLTRQEGRKFLKFMLDKNQPLEAALIAYVLGEFN
jgi:hypothetical protein